MDAFAPFLVRRDPVEGTTRYQLRGELPLLWAEQVAAAASSLSIDIDSIFAVCADQAWNATVVFRGDVRIDLLEVVRADDDWPLGRTHEIDGFHVGRLDDGAITLTVSGADEPGFLASLLRHLRQLALFPRKLDVAAEAGMAMDSFELVRRRRECARGDDRERAGGDALSAQAPRISSIFEARAAVSAGTFEDRPGEYPGENGRDAPRCSWA